MFIQAYPDVSAQGVNFSIVYQGQSVLVDGTSCSSPTFASFVSMLNDARISAFKAPLGFLNPFLYSTGYTALNDITMGNNPGCGTEGFNVCHIYMCLSRVTDLIPAHRPQLDGILVSTCIWRLVSYLSVDNACSFRLWDAQFRKVGGTGLEHALNMVDEWTIYGVYIMNEGTGKLQWYYITREALGLDKTLKSMTKGDYRKVLPCDGPQLVNRATEYCFTRCTRQQEIPSTVGHHDTGVGFSRCRV
jgi:hypothetical protein